MTRLPYLSSKLQGFGTTIFAEMSELATRHEAVNLGQGFPDFDGPDEVKQAAIDAITRGLNQYAPGSGVPALRQAIADHQRRFYDLAYDPDDEVLVTAGATEAIFATVQALCEVGDEVVLFEPFYDSYRASIAMAGAVERVVTMRPNDDAAPALGATFTYDPDDLDRVITDKTRLIILNSPHNPSGTVYDRAALEHIAEVARAHDLLVVTDEVYEHLVFEGEHIPLASLPGMRERTITISSAGKTFSCTGWKIGWVCATPELTRAVRSAKQFITYTNGTPFQYAVAQGLQLGDDFYTGFIADYRSRRDRLCRGLRAVGFDVHEPAGTYFVTADIRGLGHDDDVSFCRDLPEKVGVAAIPNSVFYVNREAGRHLVRFAFCKSDALLDEAIARLGRLSGSS